MINVQDMTWICFCKQWNFEKLTDEIITGERQWLEGQTLSNSKQSINKYAVRIRYECNITEQPKFLPIATQILVEEMRQKYTSLNEIRIN